MTHFTDKQLTFEGNVHLGIGALKLYGNFYTEWLYTLAIKRDSFRWSWGELRLTINTHDWDGTKTPIIEFPEFFAMLKASYIKINW